MGRRLYFGKDGLFKIVQFTDMHWQNGDVRDEQTRALMQQVLSIEKPDLVVLTGDVIDSLGCHDPKQSLRDAVALVEASGTPWAAIFGNHDSEGDVSRSELMDVVLEHRGTLTEPGPAHIAGVGNYVLRLHDEADERVAVALYFFDSGSYSAVRAAPGYDWIRADQVAWYREEARQLKQEADGRPVPGLAFLHIPLQEYREVWTRRTCYGNHLERVCAPPVNSGLFAAMVEEGGVSGIFCGHDHLNDYTGILHGIRLSYGRATGYNTYGRIGFARGARVIQLSKDQSFATWLRLEGGVKKEQARKTWFSKWFRPVMK